MEFPRGTEPERVHGARDSLHLLPVSACRERESYGDGWWIGGEDLGMEKGGAGGYLRDLIIL